MATIDEILKPQNEEKKKNITPEMTTDEGVSAAPEKQQPPIQPTNNRQNQNGVKSTNELAQTQTNPVVQNVNTTSPAVIGKEGNPQRTDIQQENGNSEGPGKVEQPVYDLSGIIKKLHEGTQLSEEEKKKLRKKKRRQQILSAVGDGLAALSNLYFTSKGALNAYDPSQNMTDKTKARWDKFEEEYKNRDEKYKEAALKVAIEEAGLAQKREAQDRQDARTESTNQTRREVAKANQNAADARQKKQQDFTAGEKEKDREQRDRIAKGNNNTSLRVAGIRKNGEDDSDVWSIPDGNGGEFRIPLRYKNQSTIGQLFQSLPPEVQQQYLEPELNPYTKKAEPGKFKHPTREAMERAIGQNVSNENLRKALQSLTGKQQTSGKSNQKKKTLPKVGNSNNNKGY